MSRSGPFRRSPKGGMRQLIGGSPRRPRKRPAHPGSSDEWIQVNCALMPPSGNAFPPVPWKELYEALRQWRAEERFELCFLVRKPPGLRLRFQGRQLEDRLEALLIEWLDWAERTDAI